MSINEAMDISVTGIEAQQRVMELIASNLANINTTHTIYGGPYRRRVALLSEKPLTFADELARAEGKYQFGPGGVEVSQVVEDKTPFPKVYKPGHPDANPEGFVDLPNVNLSDEMVDLIYAQHVNEANITAYNASKKMVQDTLQIQ